MRLWWVEILEFLTAAQTEKGALLSELQEKLNDALQKLSPKHRLVIILHEIEGAPQSDCRDYENKWCSPFSLTLCKKNN